MQTIEKSINDIINDAHAGKKTDKTRRNARIFSRYYGFDGSGGCSMEEAGRPYELTRESVRQIKNRIEKHIKQETHVITSLEMALSIIDENVPTSAPAIEAALLDAGITEGRMGVEQIIKAGELFLNKRHTWEVVRLHDGRFVLPKDKAGLPKQILKAATDEVSHNGAALIDKVMEAAKDIKPSDRSLFVQAVVNSIPTAHWMKSGEDVWIYFGRQYRNRLLRRLDKIFSYYQSVKVDNILEALKRSWAKDKKDYSRVVPKEIVIEIAKNEESLYYDQASDTIHSRSEDIDVDSIRPFEKGIADYIKEHEKTEVREKEIEDSLVGTCLKKKFSFSMALNHSPLIMRRRRGKYLLVGSPK